MSRHVGITPAVAEAVRAVIQTIAVVNEENTKSYSTGPKVGGPLMKQTTFNWDTEDKY